MQKICIIDYILSLIKSQATKEYPHIYFIFFQKRKIHKEDKQIIIIQKSS